jgi:hypothetical protein
MRHRAQSVRRPRVTPHGGFHLRYRDRARRLAPDRLTPQGRCPRWVIRIRSVIAQTRSASPLKADISAMCRLSFPHRAALQDLVAPQWSIRWPSVVGQFVGRSPATAKFHGRTSTQGGSRVRLPLALAARPREEIDTSLAAHVRFAPKADK